MIELRLRRAATAFAVPQMTGKASNMQRTRDTPILPRWFALLATVLLTFTDVSPSRAQDCPKIRQTYEICLYLKWPLQFQSVGYYVAKAKGLYAEAGLDVHLIEPQLDLVEPASIVENVVEGTGRYGIGTSGLLIERFERRRPVVAIAVLFQESPLVLLVKENSDVRELHELQGRRVMLEPGATELEAFFRKQNVDSSTFLSPGGAFDIQRFVDDEVVAMSAYITDELKVLQGEGIATRVFSPRYSAINFYTDVLFTSQDELDQRPDRVYRFLHVSIKGWKWAFDHVNEAVDLIEEIQKRRQASGMQVAHKTRNQLNFEAEQMRGLVGNIDQLGHMDPTRWNHIAQIYSDVDMIQADPEIAEFARTNIRNPSAWESVFVPAWGGVLAVFVLLWAAFAIAKKLGSHRSGEQPAATTRSTDRENRRVIASHIITVLFGLAITNMIGTLTTSISNEGIQFPTIALAGTFFLVSMRFLIGNQLHISSKEMEANDLAFAWTFDLLIITFQFSMMIFLASLSSVEATQAREYGFFEILIMIYAIDIIWIFFQFLSIAGNQRQEVPWEWMVLNILLIGVMLIINNVWHEIYQPEPLAWLLGVNMLGFFIDVVLCDYARLYRGRYQRGRMIHRLLQSLTSLRRRQRRKALLARVRVDLPHTQR